MKRKPARHFQEFIVWQKAHEFVLMVYGYSNRFPKQEMYGLISQIRRAAAISIPANIAEGFKKRGKPDKVRFLNIAQGSIEECRYYLILAEDLGYGDSEELKQKLVEVSKLLEAYASSILTPGSLLTVFTCPAWNILDDIVIIYNLFTFFLRQPDTCILMPG